MFPDTFKMKTAFCTWKQCIDTLRIFHTVYYDQLCPLFFKLIFFKNKLSKSHEKKNIENFCDDAIYGKRNYGTKC